MNTQVQTEEKVSKRQVAKHILLANGGTSDDLDFDGADSIRYVDIESGQTIDYKPANDKATLMLALFGARTLATNEASAARQKDASGIEQIEAIRERFALIDSGVWVDRTREGGPRIDPKLAAQALVEFMVSEGKVPADQGDSALAKVVANFEDEKEGKARISKAMSNPTVAANYKRLKGGKAATADDLAAMLG